MCEGIKAYPREASTVHHHWFWGYWMTRIAGSQHRLRAVCLIPYPETCTCNTKATQPSTVDKVCLANQNQPQGLKVLGLELRASQVPGSTTELHAQQCPSISISLCFEYSIHLTSVESYDISLVVVGFFHLAHCLQGSDVLFLKTEW